MNVRKSIGIDEPTLRAAQASVTTPASTPRKIAIVPAFNEAHSVSRVVAELREADPGLDVVVIDDGSHDATAHVASEAGAHVVRLPFNVGIGGAVQTGHQFARDHGFDIAVQVDGDGQHDPREIPRLLAPILVGEADMVVGTRFAGGDGYRSSLARRIGIRILARIVSLIVRQRVTDPTSGFRAVNRRTLELFAGDYPHDYPEAEGTVLVHRHRLRIVEVPVSMRARAEGRSSIGGVYSFVYMGKVLVALFVGLFRRYPREEP
ncbi:MAG: glycosyltransferase family 2 protein [Gaiellaceae bacterium]